MQRGAIHWLVNNRSQDAEALCLITPAAIGPQYFRESAEVINAAVGGRTTAVLTSFITACKRLDIDPFACLRDIFERIGTHPESRLAELLPDQWMAATRSAATS